MFNYFLIWVQHNTTMSTYMSLYNFLTNDCVYLAIIWMEITLWIPEWLNTSLSNQEIRYLWTICSFFLKKSICFIIIIVIIQILTPCFFINIFKIKKCSWGICIIFSIFGVFSKGFKIQISFQCIQLLTCYF